jgi:hypothetical protein
LYKTAANPTGEKHLDKLMGVHHAFDKLMKGIKFETEVNKEWSTTINPHLLYH